MARVRGRKVRSLRPARYRCRDLPACLDGLAAEDCPAAPAQVRLGYLAARSALAVLPLELLARPPDRQAQAGFPDRLRLTRTMIGLTAEVTAAEPELAAGG